MRIALIRQRYNPYGGAERFIERAMQALEQEGAEVTIVTRNWRDEDGRRALVVDPPFAGRLWRDASFSRRVQAALKGRPFDLVQSHERIPGFDIYRAGDGVHRQWLDNRLEHATALERFGVRVNPYHLYVCAAERAMFEHPRLRAVICNSRMVASEISRRFPVAAGKVHVIYNGVDLGFFHPDRRSALRAEARSQFGYEQADTVFSFVGSGFSRKGLGLAIDALAQTRNPNLKLVVAGRDREQSRFVARAERLGVKDRVTFLGGLEDVRPVYAASDCFLLPTRYDPFPNAALEALAMGVPIIVSDHCGAAELVEGAKNGWVCRPHDTAALAAILLEAAAVSKGKLDTAARTTAQAFAIEKMALQMIDLYRSLAPKAVGEPLGH